LSLVVHSNADPKLDIECIYQYYVAHVNLKIKHAQKFFLGDLELLFETCLSKVLATLRSLLYPFALPILWIYESLVLVRRFAIVFSYVCHGTRKLFLLPNWKNLNGKKTKTIYIIDLTSNTTFDPTILDYTNILVHLLILNFSWMV
jgi:hypothetical protein